ncbi:MAG: GNAT family N-acetyltransferase [Erysipelotrichaceae bacterium]|jgi:ribosomal protein S18 acetylase RimI-like enzyme|nr:GNAT family N-acetyltransferase [Erysipelotrichaceae bacterium]
MNLETKTIRSGTINDLDQVYPLMRTLFDPTTILSKATLGALMKKNRYQLYVLVTNTKIIGFCWYLIFKEHHTIWIDYLGIHPKFQNQGYGTYLISHLLNNHHFKPQYAFVELELDQETPGNNFNRRVMFYQQQGFHLTNIKYLVPLDDGIPVALAMWSLNKQYQILNATLSGIIKEIMNTIYLKQPMMPRVRDRIVSDLDSKHLVLRSLQILKINP